MPEIESIWICVTGCRIEDVVDEELLIERLPLKKGETEARIKRSTGFIQNDEMWRAFLKATRTWPKEHKVLIGLVGENGEHRGEKTWKLEHFREYSLCEAYKWMTKELEPRSRLEMSELWTRDRQMKEVPMWHARTSL